MIAQVIAEHRIPEKTFNSNVAEQVIVDKFFFSTGPSLFVAKLEQLRALKQPLWELSFSSSTPYEVHTYISQIYELVPGLPREGFDLAVSLVIFLMSEAGPEVQKHIDSCERPFVERLAGIFFRCSKDPSKGGERWGELNLTNDGPCLRAAILLAQIEFLEDRLAAYLRKLVESLSSFDQELLYHAVYQCAGSPNTHELSWGEWHAFDDLGLLAKALHTIGVLEPKNSSQVSEYVANWEEISGSRSCFFDIVGEDPAPCVIGYVNPRGMSKQQAVERAHQIGGLFGKEFSIQGVFVDSAGDFDAAAINYGISGVVLPSGRLLLHRWIEFFIANSEGRYLQVCEGNAVADVNAALQVLPADMQRRLLVIAIQPSHLIAPPYCFSALNVVLEEVGGDSSLECISKVREASRLEVSSSELNSDGAALAPLLAQFLEESRSGLIQRWN